MKTRSSKRAHHVGKTSLVLLLVVAFWTPPALLAIWWMTRPTPQCSAADFGDTAHVTEQEEDRV